jgi:hypothetical protein
MKNSKLPAIAASLTLSAILAACGGGGGYSAGDTPVPPTAPTTPQDTPITAANFVTAGATVLTANEAMGMAANSASGVVLGATLEAAPTSVTAPTLALITRAIKSPRYNFVAGVIVSETVPCDSGTVTLSGTVKAADQFSNGDHAVFTTSNCVIGGVTLKGGLTLDLSNITGDITGSTAGTATMAIVFKDFSVTSGVETITIGGDLTMGVNQASASSRQISLSGNALRLALLRGGSVVADRTLAAYQISGATAGSTLTRRYDYSLYGSSSTFAQFRVSVKTKAPFVGALEGNPSQGSMVIHGGAGSMVTVTAIDSTSVRLEFDDNGDGAITQTVVLTWAELYSKS